MMVFAEQTAAILETSLVKHSQIVLKDSYIVVVTENVNQQ
jgi:hypothetical protein